VLHFLLALSLNPPTSNPTNAPARARPRTTEKSSDFSYTITIGVFFDKADIRVVPSKEKNP